MQVPSVKTLMLGRELISASSEMRNVLFMIENYLHDEKGNGLKLSHGILKKTYQNNFIDCRLDADGKEDEDELKSRLCFELHEAAIEHETEDPDGKIPMMTHWNGMYTYITFIQYTIIMHVQCYCISNHPQRRLND